MPGYCHECGEHTKQDDKYCSECGADLSSENTASVNNSSKNPKPETDYSKPDGEEKAANTETETQSTSTSRYGSFWERLAAFLVDWFVIFVVIMMASFAIGFVIGLAGVLLGMNESKIDGLFNDYGYLFNLLGAVVAWLYYAGMECSIHQATIGKKLLSMKVTGMDGGKVTFARATGRHFAKAISSLTLFIGYIMIAFTQKKQGLHDILASTVVVKTR